MANNKSKGDNGEDIAVKYLIENGARIVARNFRCRLGEIDVIAEYENYLCFIEVKLRNNTAYGCAIEAVTPAKQKTIRMVAQVYLMQNCRYNSPCRFDVIGIDMTENKENITYIKNAF